MSIEEERESVRSDTPGAIAAPDVSLLDRRRPGAPGTTPLMIATDDRRLRIVTGSGLADRLPDGTASDIIRGTIAPLFRDGRMRDGVLAGLDQIRLSRSRRG